MAGLLLEIARRQLSARKRQGITAVVGMMIGVAVLLITLSLFGGLLDSFTSRILEVSAHVTMKSEAVAGAGSRVLLQEGTVELRGTAGKGERMRVRNVLSLLRVIERELGKEVTAASPYLATQALAVYGVNDATIPVVGVIPSREAELSNPGKYLESGSMSRFTASRNGILLGRRAADDLGVRTNDRIRLVSLTGRGIPVQVVGVYRFGVEASDRGAFVNLRLAQTLEGALPGEATGIGMQLADIDRADEIAGTIERLTGWRTETWKETNAGFLSIFTFLQMLFRVVVGFVIVICALGVANILVTTVSEKRRDIALMKSYGLSGGDISRLYILQGGIVALIGSVAGLLLGLIGIWVFSQLPSVGADGLGPVDSTTFDMSWSPWYAIVAVASASIAGVVASLAPARAVARVVPAEVFRQEG